MTSDPRPEKAPALSVLFLAVAAAGFTAWKAFDIKDMALRKAEIVTELRPAAVKTCFIEEVERQQTAIREDTKNILPLTLYISPDDPAIQACADAEVQKEFRARRNGKASTGVTAAAISLSLFFASGKFTLENRRRRKEEKKHKPPSP